MPCDHAQVHVDIVRELVELGELQALVNPAAVPSP